MKKHQKKSGLPVNQFGKESKIPIDKKLNVINPIAGNNISTPMVWTICIHVGIIALVVYTNLAPDMTQKPAVETTLFTPETLAQLQSDIESNRNQAIAATVQSKNETPNKKNVHQNTINHNNSPSPKKSSDNTDSSLTPIPDESNLQNNTNKSNTVTLPNVQISPEMQEINQQIAERQRQFDEAMQRSAERLDHETQQEILRQNEALQQKYREQQEQQDLVNALEAIAAGNLDKEKKNRENMKEAAKKLKKMQEEKNKQTEITQKNMSNEDLPTSKDNNGKSSISSGSKSSNTTIESAISAKIKSKLIPPRGSKGFTSTVEIVVDSNGHVDKANATGEHLALNIASEQAVYDASPLPINGSDRRTFTVKLNGL